MVKYLTSYIYQFITLTQLDYFKFDKRLIYYYRDL